MFVALAEATPAPYVFGRLKFLWALSNFLCAMCKTNFCAAPPPKLCTSALVSHFCAIGDTISCDAPYGAIGFRASFFCDTHLIRPVFGLR